METATVPILLVAAVVFDREGLVLLTRHAPYWKWHFPDGEVRFGEKIDEALRRSFSDDVGLQLRLRDRSPWLVTETVNAAKGLHYVTCHFRAEIDIDRRMLSEKESLHMLWVQPRAFAGAPADQALGSTRKALQKIVDEDDG